MLLRVLCRNGSLGLGDRGQLPIEIVQLRSQRFPLLLKLELVRPKQKEGATLRVSQRRISAPSCEPAPNSGLGVHQRRSEKQERKDYESAHQVYDCSNQGQNLHK